MVSSAMVSMVSSAVAMVSLVVDSLSASPSKTTPADSADGLDFLVLGWRLVATDPVDGLDFFFRVAEARAGVDSRTILEILINNIDL